MLSSIRPPSIATSPGCGRDSARRGRRLRRGSPGPVAGWSCALSAPILLFGRLEVFEPFLRGGDLAGYLLDTFEAIRARIAPRIGKLCPPIEDRRPIDQGTDQLGVRHRVRRTGEEHLQGLLLFPDPLEQFSGFFGALEADQPPVKILWSRVG